MGTPASLTQDVAGVRGRTLKILIRMLSVLRIFHFEDNLLTMGQSRSVARCVAPCYRLEILPDRKLVSSIKQYNAPDVKSPIYLQATNKAGQTVRRCPA